MKHRFKLATVAAAALLAGTVSASAAIIDFTEGLPGASSGTEMGGWTLTSNGTLRMNEAGPGSVGSVPLAGENDGVGVNDDEITHSREYVTVTFTKAVRLVGAFFLDLYIAPGGLSKEIANISVGNAVGSPADASLEATALKSASGRENRSGYGELLGLTLRGSEFTFFAGATNDNNGSPDFALAGLQVAPIPLPAGMLLLPTAIGALAIARRRKKQPQA